MVTSTCQHVSVGENDVDGDELGGEVIVGARDDDGEVEGEVMHDDAQKPERRELTNRLGSGRQTETAPETESPEPGR